MNPFKHRKMRMSALSAFKSYRSNKNPDMDTISNVVECISAGVRTRPASWTQKSGRLNEDDVETILRRNGFRFMPYFQFTKNGQIISNETFSEDHPPITYETSTGLISSRHILGYWKPHKQHRVDFILVRICGNKMYSWGINTKSTKDNKRIFKANDTPLAYRRPIGCILCNKSSVFFTTGVEQPDWYTPVDKTQKNHPIPGLQGKVMTMTSRSRDNNDLNMIKEEYYKYEPEMINLFKQTCRSFLGFEGSTDGYKIIDNGATLGMGSHKQDYMIENLMKLETRQVDPPKSETNNNRIRELEKHSISELVNMIRSYE